MHACGAFPAQLVTIRAVGAGLVGLIKILLAPMMVDGIERDREDGQRTDWASNFRRAFDVSRGRSLLHRRIDVVRFDPHRENREDVQWFCGEHHVLWRSSGLYRVRASNYGIPVDSTRKSGNGGVSDWLIWA